MDDSFYPLQGAVITSDLVGITRAMAIFRAINLHPDYKIIELRAVTVVEKFDWECIVVDVECDGVPTQNDQGIQFRERLAICVPEDVNSEVMVLALRHSFPQGIMHQSSRDLSTASSLCLYFEPLSAVLRAWTPQRFLRRIQWWLTATSRNELHPTDQPVEQLFFVARHELILPWNFDELRKQDGIKFIVSKGVVRQDMGQSFFITPAEGKNSRKSDASLIECMLPPIVHGAVERDPQTFGELVDLLRNRGVDLLAILRDKMQEGISQNGIPAANDDQFFVILLHVPVKRSRLGEAECHFKRAFLLIDGLALGEKIGALFKHDGKYYNATGVPLSSNHSDTWRKVFVCPMEVQHFCDAAGARQQSGITTPGPKGLLVGAGSLGSALLNIWGRSGWGQWTVIDKDHIKPHNLMRHTAIASHVGQTKVDVVAQLHDDAMIGASRIIPICADVLGSLTNEIEFVLNSAELVVDASTTLEYPRRISNNGGAGRYITIFITPDGNSSVLMAEDCQREIRLRTLEAQYYRAMIHAQWGQDHLTGNLGTFWSGASCRDISMVLPYSRVLCHAATLAEQIQSISKNDGAVLRVWRRTPSDGAVTVYSVDAHQERECTFGEMRLFIDAGIEEKLRNMRAGCLPLETGGILIGYYDFLENMVVIVDAIAAPSDSKSTVTSFERGIRDVAEFIAEVGKRTADIVHYIGEWHSHPPGHSAAPSGDDIIQLAGLSEGMARDGLPAVSLIVGEDNIQILQGSKCQ